MKAAGLGDAHDSLDRDPRPFPAITSVTGYRKFAALLRREEHQNRNLSFCAATFRGKARKWKD
jgi:hypothetical protein